MIANRQFMVVAGLLLAVMASIIAGSRSTDAAPVAPTRRALPDEIMVLADIKKVNLDIREFSPLLKNAGLLARNVEVEWEKELEKAGLEVVDDAGPDVATLQVDSRAADDADIPDGVGFATFLKVYRPVRVEGFDKPMRLPIYVDVTGGADNEDDLGETSFATVKMLLTNFISRQKVATSEKAARGD